jgi:hypothetical protein
MILFQQIKNIIIMEQTYCNQVIHQAYNDPSFAEDITHLFHPDDTSSDTEAIATILLHQYSYDTDTSFGYEQWNETYYGMMDILKHDISIILTEFVEKEKVFDNEYSFEQFELTAVVCEYLKKRGITDTEDIEV